MPFFFGYGSIYCQAAEGVGAVEDDDALVVFAPRFQDSGQAPDVGVGSAAHVLDVVDYDVDFVQCGFQGTTASVEGIYGQAVHLRVAHVFARFCFCFDSVFKCE